MAEKHYHGSCQCGAVDFDVDLDLGHTVTCNCSRCRRLGAVLAFAPRDKFTLNRGEGELAEYQFNKHLIHHLFCKACGIQSFSFGETPDGKQMVAVNVNCLDDIDARSLPSQAFDGASA